MTLYDLSKTAVKSLPFLTEEQLTVAAERIEFWRKKSPYSFYMLYGKEINYFTLFRYVAIAIDADNLGKNVIECLKEIGNIYSIAENEDGAIECWVLPIGEDKEPVVLYLFNYDEGLVSYV